MLTKTVKYVDFNGKDQEKTFFFHMSEPELVKNELGPNGFANRAQTLSSANDISGLMDMFADLLLRTYGEKSEDGQVFVQNPELSLRFSQHAAYPKLFLELAMDPNMAADFIDGILPASMKESPEYKEEMARVRGEVAAREPQDFKKKSSK